MTLGGVRNCRSSGTLLERATGGGESPVRDMPEAPLVRDLSRVGHEESCLKLGGPPSKAEYAGATDSGEVP